MNEKSAAELGSILPPRLGTAAREKLELSRKIEELERQRENAFASGDLDSAHVRQALATRHPMLEHQYFVQTDEFDNFYNIVWDHASVRKSGLYVSGQYRVGKTAAIMEAIRRLSIELPHLGVLDYSAARNPSITKTGFCRDILNWLGYPLSTRQDAAEVLIRLAMSQAAQAGGRTCVFFIDEAQKLAVRHLSFLLELWNSLRRYQFVLVTILIGQGGNSGMESLRTLTEAQDHGAVIARFFTVPYVFGGIHGKEQLTNYLRAFDEELYYPSNTTWSYSRYFLRRAFDGGWRLAQETPAFWGALEVRSGASSKEIEKFGFRLAFLNDAIHAFLLDAMTEDKRGFKPSAKRWEEAVMGAASRDQLVG